jgi:hypothetical protein
MQLYEPFEKGIGELDESSHSSDIHDLGVYVFISFLTLINKTPDEVLYPFL